jgi:hypothetical protein
VLPECCVANRCFNERLDCRKERVRSPWWRTLILVCDTSSKNWPVLNLWIDLVIGIVRLPAVVDAS